MCRTDTAIDEVSESSGKRGNPLFAHTDLSAERSRRYLEDELAKRSSECAGILQNSENFSKMLESATKQHQADDEKLAAYEKRVLEDAKKQAATFDELTNTQVCFDLARKSCAYSTH